MLGEHFGEQEREKKRISDKEKQKKAKEKIISQEEMKERLYLRHTTQEVLEKLHDLIQSGDISLEHISRDMMMSPDEKKLLEAKLESIFEIYDEIHEKQKYIPTQYILTKKDILQAIYNGDSRKNIQQKVLYVLTSLSQVLHPQSFFSFSLFSGFLFGHSKDLVRTQEFYIDTQNILSSLD